MRGSPNENIKRPSELNGFATPGWREVRANCVFPFPAVLLHNLSADKITQLLGEGNQSCWEGWKLHG